MVDATLDELGLSLDELCRAAAVSPQWVAERARAGLLVVQGDEATAWRFDVVALTHVRRMAHVERDFECGPELAALVADLQAEIADLRGRLRRAGLA